MPSDRLALFTLAADLDDVLAIRKPLLRRFPRIALHSDLVDAHLYIVSRWALSVLPTERTSQMESFVSCFFYHSLFRFFFHNQIVQQGEFVPALVRGQFRREMRARAAALQRGASAAVLSSSISTSTADNTDDDESDENP